MSGPPIVIIGGGEHARVLIEALRSGPFAERLLGFVDPAPCERAQALGVARLGGDGALPAHRGALGVLGFGAVDDRTRRREVVQRLDGVLQGWACVVHHTAWISPTATLGAGSVVLAGAVVQTGARIGVHCVVNDGAVIEHDVVLGDFVQVGPRAAIGGGATVGPDAYIGLGASVRDHVSVGAGALVGMGAVVVDNVVAGARVMGVPAR